MRMVIMCLKRERIRRNFRLKYKNLNFLFKKEKYEITEQYGYDYGCHIK